MIALPRPHGLALAILAAAFALTAARPAPQARARTASAGPVSRSTNCFELGPGRETNQPS